jgi:hypothetical protein
MRMSMRRGTFGENHTHMGQGHLHNFASSAKDNDNIEGNRACSSMGGFLKAKSRNIVLDTQRRTQQKILGIAGMGLFVLGAITLYFSSPILGALLVTLGAATAGYIPWVHAPTKPIVFSYMSEHTSESKQNTHQSEPKSKSPSPVVTEGVSASPSPSPSSSSSSSAEMLRAASRELTILSFSPAAKTKLFEKLLASEAETGDTFDLIAAQLFKKSPRSSK